MDVRLSRRGDFSGFPHNPARAGPVDRGALFRGLLQTFVSYREKTTVNERNV